MLASSSSGNASVIATESTRILIDAGLSRKSCFSRLAAVEIKPESLSAVVVSHGHLDHAGHAAAVSRALNIPVYMSEGTAAALKPDCCVLTFQPGDQFMVGDVRVQTYSVPHDAAEPVGFSFIADGHKVSCVTDLGWIPEDVARQLVGSDVLMIESNYSCAMLKIGPHPWSVKERVMGESGHLSNEAVCEFVERYLDGCTTTLILSHLSERSNHPVIAESMVAAALSRKGLTPTLLIAKGKEVSASVLY